jgi:hypothetical protein
MFAAQTPGERRDASADRQTVVPWLEGSYPEFFFVLDAADADHFFWETSDWFNAQALREQPQRAGLFDLNRYQNR